MARKEVIEVSGSIQMSALSEDNSKVVTDYCLSSDFFFVCVCVSVQKKMN